MRQLIVLIGIPHIFFFFSEKKNKLCSQFEGFWLFDQMLNGSDADLQSMPGNMILNTSTGKSECTGLWITKNRDEANFTWSVSENGQVLKINPEQSPSVSNMATVSLSDYKGSYTVQGIDDKHIILQKGKMIIKFKRYINN